MVALKISRFDTLMCKLIMNLLFSYITFSVGLVMHCLVSLCSCSVVPVSASCLYKLYESIRVRFHRSFLKNELLERIIK